MYNYRDSYFDAQHSLISYLKLKYILLLMKSLEKNNPDDMFMTWTFEE